MSEGDAEEDAFFNFRRQFDLIHVQPFYGGEIRGINPQFVEKIVKTAKKLWPQYDYAIYENGRILITRYLNE